MNKLEKSDILQAYVNRIEPNYLLEIILAKPLHFNNQVLKPEFIKSTVFKIFKNIAEDN